MALHDMADLVAEGGRQLGLVVEQGEQPARHHHIAAGRMRIGQRLVEHDEAELSGNGGLAHDLLADAIDIGLQRRVRIGRPDVALELARQGRDAGTRLAGGRLRRIVGKRAGGGTGEEREKYE